MAAPERLVFPCHFSDPSGARRERPGFPAEMRVDVRFEALDAARTKVTVRQSGLERDQDEVQGWIEAFERLAGELAHMGGGVSEATMFVYPPAQPVILQRRVFAAPRALVWESCTEARHMAAWWGPRGYVNEACEVDARPGGRWRVAMDRLEEILDALAPAGAGAKRELVLSRVVDAPCALVFEAWTSPEHVDRWMGPRGYTTETLSMDVRVGGAWRYTMTGPDGTVYPNRVTYRAIEPPARLEYRHDADTDEDPHGFDVWVSFAEEEEGRRTRVSMRMRLASKEARDFTIGFGAVELGYQTLARLAEHVGGGPARRSGLIHEGDEHGT